MTPVSQTLHFKTQTKVPRVGVMLVGLGGNNGSTVAAGILANKNNMTWSTKASYHSYLYRADVAVVVLFSALSADVVYSYRGGCFVTSCAVGRVCDVFFANLVLFRCGAGSGRCFVTLF